MFVSVGDLAYGTSAAAAEFAHKTCHKCPAFRRFDAILDPSVFSSISGVMDRSRVTVVCHHHGDHLPCGHPGDVPRHPHSKKEANQSRSFELRAVGRATSKGPHHPENQVSAISSRGHPAYILNHLEAMIGSLVVD